MNENDPGYRNSTVSSMYSQPSPTMPQDMDMRAIPKSAPGPGDVSPLSTPRSSFDFAASDTSLVSPIEKTMPVPARVPLPETGKKSHIPRPAPASMIASPQTDTVSPATRAKKQDTKWDKYSGEPTTADHGKSASVKPGQPLEMQYPQLKERTKQILAGLRDRDSAKQSPWGRQPPPVSADPLDHPPAPKEPWKGASGRTALVEPVTNNPAARNALQYPQRNVSRMTPAADLERTQSPEPVSAPRAQIRGPGTARAKSPEPAQQIAQRAKKESSRKAVPAPIEVPEPQHSLRLVTSEESIKPIAPLKVKSPQSRTVSETQDFGSLHSPFQSPKPTLHEQVTSNVGHNNMDGSTAGRTVQSPEIPTQAPTYRSEPVGEDIHQQQGMVHEPASHFSWTTYATSVNDSPGSMAPTQMNSSPVPAMPPMPTPIVIRKRPVSTTASPLPFSNITMNQSRNSIVSRKPLASDKVRSASMMSTSKSLPPTPTELEAGDKISTLEARLEDLSRRRRNISKIDRELHDSLKRNAIEYNTRKRKEVEQKITSMGTELDDVMREEHEIGVQLHRAQKKRDAADCYENPTGLWIKRVTS